MNRIAIAARAAVHLAASLWHGHAHGQLAVAGQRAGTAPGAFE